MPADRHLMRAALLGTTAHVALWGDLQLPGTTDPLSLPARPVLGNRDSEMQRPVHMGTLNGGRAS